MSCPWPLHERDCYAVATNETDTATDHDVTVAIVVASFVAGLFFFVAVGSIVAVCLEKNYLASYRQVTLV